MSETQKRDKLFHKGAYIDSLRELKIPVIVIFALLLLVEFGYMLWQDHEVVRGIPLDNPENLQYIHFTFQYLAAPLTAVFMVISPLLLLWLFRHQLKQKGSDVYYALPVSPESRLFSGVLAVLSIDLFLLLTGGLIVELLILTFPHIQVFPYENSFFLTIGNYFAASLFTTAVMMLALAMSGTALSTILMDLSILLVPRITIILWSIFATYGNDSLPDGLAGTIFDDRLNVAENLITGYLLHDAFDAVKSIRSLIYTLIIGILYAVLALYLYHKRPSETIGHPAVSDRIQGIFRTALSCGACLVPLTIILEPLYRNHHPYYSWDINSIAICYGISIFAYFFYELITTHSLKNCLKAAPGLLYVLLFNIIFVFAVWEGHQIIDKDIPKAENVQSIYMTMNPDCYHHFHNEEDYYYMAMRNYEITDAEAISLLCDAAKHSITNEPYDEIVEGLRLHFTGGVLLKERNINITETDFHKLMEILAKDPAYWDIFTKPVPREDIASISASANKYGSGPKGNEDEIYQVYCDQLKQLSMLSLDQLVLLQSELNVSGGASIYILLKNGQKINLCVDQWLTPLQQTSGDRDALFEALKDFNDSAHITFIQNTPDAWIDLPRQVQLTIRFHGIIPQFHEDETWTESQASLLSTAEWSFPAVLTTDGWDFSQYDDEDFPHRVVQQLVLHTRYWNGWDVLDSSQPYMSVDYTQIWESDHGFEIVKEVHTDYRLEKNVIDWLQQN